ncbi:hypothetical protein [Sedimentitalea sp.]|uniref:hypothetical protein n=1 Tax=Sedimentitalea sp. TaxID=2048915 RepID=UPI00329907FF
MRWLPYLLIGFAAYAATLFISQSLLAHYPESQSIRVLVALSPMLPAAFICGVVVRSIRNLDELQLRLQLEALAISFAGTALFTFSYGFLEGIGLPKISMFVVWPLMATLWVIGVILGRLRFR